MRDEASTTYLASFQPAEDFGQLLRREAFARGMAAAGQLVFIGDGAAWVWELPYLRKSRDRMLYATFRSRGYFIGFGVVEAGCKTVVGKRLKDSGMFWSLHGAQNVLTLRTALLGHHFDAGAEYLKALAVCWLGLPQIQWWRGRSFRCRW